MVKKLNISKQGFFTIVEGINYLEGKIDIDSNIIQEIKKDAFVVIFKNIFPLSYVYELRETAVNFHFKHSNYADCGIGLPANMRRIDDLKDRDFAARYLQILSFSIFDDSTPHKILDFIKVWGEFINKMRGLNLNAHFSEKDDFVFYLNAYHYPDGGFLGKHHETGVLDYVAQTIPFSESVVYCSKLGTDFQSGGLYFGKRNFDDSGDLFYAEPLLSPGDMLFFVNDLHHETKPIIGDKQAGFDPMKNRFIFCLVSYPKSILSEYITNK